MRQKGVYLMPALVVSDVLARFGEQYGFSVSSMDKIRRVYERGPEAAALAREVGVKIGFGRDIMGIELHPFQGEEFTLCAKVELTVDTLPSAPSVNAEMMMLGDKLGVIKPKAWADILVVEGDPTRDLAVFTHAGENIAVIIRSGKFRKNTLN